MLQYIETRNIPLDLIELTPWHPRRNVEEADIEAIGGNIAEKGQMQSIRVVPRGDKYVIAFGGRRVAGSRLKGLKEIRAEIWDMSDTELINDQARELVHTASLDGSPDIDTFLRFAFHHNVEERISGVSNFERLPQCPQCYICTKRHIGLESAGRCPAFLSQAEFAEKIIGNMKHSNISMAISRDRLREEVPEVKELNLPSPLVTIPILFSLARDEVLDKAEVISLANKAADGQLGSLTEVQKKQGSGPVKTLQMVGTYLRKKDKQKIPRNVRERLIYNPNYGPAEAEYDILPKRKPQKTDQDRFRDIINMAEKLADNLDRMNREGKLNQMDLTQFAITLRILADYFSEFTKLAEGGQI